MAIYWHPFLTQFLRQDYGSLLVIEDEVNLGDMPLRLDLLLDNREQYASYIGYLILLHSDMLMEVLTMREMTAEEIGLNMESILRFLRFYDDDKVMEGVSRLYGNERLLKELTRRFGEDGAMKELTQMMGEENAVKGGNADNS